MLVYWEQSTSVVQEANFDVEEDDEGCEIQKPQMKNAENKEQITNPMVKTIIIFDLQMNNNYNNARFAIHIFKDDMLGVLIESTRIFVQSS